MNPASYHIRRATVEDLNDLRQLWKESLLPVAELEKRFTEFQVAVGQADGIVGALGLEMVGHQGKLHAEAFLRPELVDVIRPLFWDRLQTLAQNHGLSRFWTQEDSPFWPHYAGFKPPSPEELQKFPPQFGDRQAPWLTLQLKEEGHSTANLDEHLNQFRQAQQENIARIMRQARRMKVFATLIALLLFIAVILAGVYVLRRYPFLLGR